MGDALKEITILPLGDIEPEPLEWISAALIGAFGATSRISPGGALPREAWMPARKQYDSARIILCLETQAATRRGKLLGVCDVDLGSPILTFVFGAAQVDGRGAVISLARLRQEVYGLAPNRALFLQRCAKEAIHEIGHTCGLQHCFRYDCIMHAADSIEGADLKRQEFCPDCAAKLARAEWR
jgi:archaemetzincin